MSQVKLDRGALGCRPHGQRRHRPVSVVVVRMERALPRHRARLVAQPRSAAAGLRDAPVRVRRSLRPARREASTQCVGQLRTVHDGFTLNDLVSYDRKHNEANTETTAMAPMTTGRGTAGQMGRPATLT